MHRQQRVEELPPPRNSDDLRNILGDTKDKEYPIFRTATPPDQYQTLSTGQSKAMTVKSQIKDTQKDVTNLPTKDNQK